MAKVTYDYSKALGFISEEEVEQWDRKYILPVSGSVS